MNLALDGFKFDLAVLIGRDADVQDVGLAVVEHFAEAVVIDLAAAGHFALFLSAFRPDVVKADEFDVVEQDQVAQMKTGDAAAAERYLYFSIAIHPLKLCVLGQGGDLLSLPL